MSSPNIIILIRRVFGLGGRRIERREGGEAGVTGCDIGGNSLSPLTISPAQLQNNNKKFIFITQMKEIKPFIGS